MKHSSRTRFHQTTSGLIAIAGFLIIVVGGIARSAPQNSRGGHRAPALYVANTEGHRVTIYPLDGRGNLPSIVGRTHLGAPSGIAYAGGKIYVANLGWESITVYSATADGAVEPLRKIEGDHTHLDHPSAVAVDASGAIYVTNRTTDVNGHDSVTVYAPGSDGDATPRAIIRGPSTDLRDPNGIAVDTQGTIYVSNGGIDKDRGGITVYAARASGDAKPIRELSGTKTNLSWPRGVAVDSMGQLYVTTGGTETNPGPGIAIFAAGANGDVAPIASPDACLSGNWPTGSIALDPRGNIYVTQYAAENQPRVLFFQRSGKGSPPDYYCSEGTIVSLGGPATKMSNIGGIAVDSVGDIYVIDEDAQSVNVFQVGDTNTPPSATISSGDPDSIIGPESIAFDRNGDIYVANNNLTARAPNSITIYPAGSNAAAAPVATIAGEYGPDYVGDPEALAVDARGKLYVANQHVEGGDLSESLPDAVDIYSRQRDGSWVRSARIAGKKTGIATPSALAFDRGGNLYVLGSGSIGIFAPGAGGDVPPKATIANGEHDDNTRLNSAVGMTLDAADNIYVTNDGDGQSAPAVIIYKAGSAGSASPMAIISGAKTGLAQPLGIAVAADGRIYVANRGTQGGGAADKITVYAPGARGDVAPVATISGPATGLDGIAGIAIGPALLTPAAPELLASYDWSLKASPNLKNNPPPKEVVERFMRAIQLS